MSDQNKTDLSWDAARQLLEVGPEANDREVHEAYIKQVRSHPPDRDPDAFERLRDAYALLSNPKQRAARVLAGPDPRTRLPDLLDIFPASRRFIGPTLWLDLLKEKRG